MVEVDSLVSRRPRRSTAGNRMEAALAEMALDDTVKDGDDDKDFFVEKYEEDIFGSDFESTDEEAEQQVEDGDQQVQNEEKQARKAERSRLEKATAAAAARQRATFNPTASSSAPKPKTKKRRVTDDTGDAAEDSTNAEANALRKSARKHTILNTSEHVKRMKISEKERAGRTSKRGRTQVQRALTQDELIARALDNEEGNIVQHRDYLKLEEERRRKARVVRPSIQGPLVRWVSRKEEVRSASRYGYSLGTFSQLSNGNGPGSTFSATAELPTASTLTPNPNPYINLLAKLSAPALDTMKVTKNYLVHELGQHEGVSKPSWGETMEVMFGDHVKWGEVKAYSNKGRPVTRPKQICPISGLTAKYRDPRTGVPYANIQAYKTLTTILDHGFIWSKELGCYTKKDSSVKTVA
ncbi:YL1 nuclear protein-domain-containing protein [Mycena floridula]|nr:YL1 nuclear protein-domain-containing protein [Mycena floridula]